VSPFRSEPLFSAVVYTPRMKLIDLSHTIFDGLVTYPGLPAPRISDHLSRDASASHYAPGTTFHIGRIEMVANTGTYLDTPAHRFEEGVDLAGIALERLAGIPGIVIQGNARSSFHRDDLSGKAVLVHTGWSKHFGTPQYGSGHPFLTREIAEMLVERGAALVGIDSLNIDDTADGSRPVHTVLLAAGIPIVEHLTGLDQLPGSRFTFFAVPPKVRGLGTFPVRAFAVC
jgi:arylformamidase